jgi:hypothetical protein
MSEPEAHPGPTTLAIDIGGTGLKASVLDANGGKIVDRLRTKTPYPCPPRVLIRELDKLTYRLPSWDRVSVGFPGFVRTGRVLTAPNLCYRTRRRIGNRRWSKRVLAAVEMFDGLLHIDRLYVGGGNAKEVTVDLGRRAEAIDNAAGILGGIKLWQLERV